MDQILSFFNENIVGILIMFVLGVFFIVKGGDLFVDAASWLAEVSGIPKFIIGATVVSLATTLPELLTSVFATVDGQLEIAIGNAVGSVTANIGLIMGISLLCIPSEIKRRQFAPQALMMAFAAAILCIAAPTGSVGVVVSVILLAVFAVFMWRNVSSAIADREEATVELADTKPSGKVIFVNIAKFVLGAAGIVLGADMLVEYGTLIAEISGIPENIIAITLVAIGTSLPELVTTITAIVKKQASLSVGNIIGANIFDLTLILPICSFVSGGKLTVAQPQYAANWPEVFSAGLDFPVCLAVGLISIVPPIITKKFYRWQGVLLILVYIVYIISTCMLQGV